MNEGINQMEKSVVTITINPALDKITGISQVVPNKKLRCNLPKHEAGGGGINVSRAIKRLGGKSIAIFPCGGPNGEILKSKLEEEKIDYITTAIEKQTRENITIFEGDSNHQYRFIMPGPTLSEKEWQKTFEEIKKLDPPPDYIVASGSTPNGVPKDFYKQIAELANKLESKLIVDTSGKQLKLAAKAGLYMLKPNMRELGTLAGNEIESEAHQKQAAREIVETGNAEVVVVSMGAGGALLVTKDYMEHIRTPTVPIRSKLGAGDSMVAGIVFSLAKGKSIREAVMYGVAAGAAAVMTPGIELCNKPDTDKLYENLLEDYQ
jgi:6-phosphofructokinase 2